VSTTINAQTSVFDASIDPLIKTSVKYGMDWTSDGSGGYTVQDNEAVVMSPTVAATGNGQYFEHHTDTVS
jgi:hypothetical protein